MQNNTFKALFVGQNIITLKKVDSTNSYLKNLLSNSTPTPTGTVILAENQFAGRGQFNNSWQAKSGKNLTFSLLLRPLFLEPSRIFTLNVAISVAINDVLRKYTGDDCKVKWPNDIYYRNKKMGGILIESSLRGRSVKNAIVGIGINVNEVYVDVISDHRISLKGICGRPLNRNLILKQLFQAIQRRYIELEEGNYKELSAEYHARLMGINEKRLFQINGNMVSGTIRGVTDTGTLNLEIEGQLRSFQPKTISFVL